MRRSSTALALLLATASAAGADLVEFKPGDHVAIIGNTLADRMQHDGRLEALIQAEFPEHKLVIRNLGFPGDEVDFRLRSAGFGSPDEWLARTRADVIFAFFGYNESWAGLEGLDKFRADLDAFIKQTLAQNYNGKSAPKLVLFSPTPLEAPLGRDLPDPSAANERIGRYAAAMAEVARANGVVFLDLFEAIRSKYDRFKIKPITINGLHLNDEGNSVVAWTIVSMLKGREIRPDAPRFQQIRRAVLAKNFTWFNRYRTVDGYSIFGGRADLSFVDGQTNRVVAQREMEVLDVMTANRDRAIWAAAQGKDYQVDDSNTPPFLTVKTNKPGAGPNGEHLFLSGEEAIGRMTIGQNLKVNLFASEKEFPDLAKPVQMSFDARGRLWVACWPTYPHWRPKEEMDDKILILEDTDGDGRADKQTTFADRLHCPTGFEIANGGVYVAQQPDLMFLKDLDGDDKADTRERVLSGLDSADTHHAANSFQLDPGGALYFQEGTFHQTSVETPYGPAVRCSNAGIFRYEPKSQKFDVYVSYGFANPHGHAFDRWGQDIVVDGTGAVPTHATLFSGHVDYPRQARRSRPLGLPPADPPLPRRRVPRQPPLPRRLPGEPAGPQRDRLPGHPPLQDRGQGRQPGRHRARADPLVARPQLPAQRHRGRPRRRDLFPRLAEPDHRPHAAQPPRPQPRPDPRPGLPRDLRRPPALPARRGSPASRSRSSWTCSRTPRTASATGPRSSSAPGTAAEVLAAPSRAGSRQARQGRPGVHEHRT